jgi:hypothetical protein
VIRGVVQQVQILYPALHVLLIECSVFEGVEYHEVGVVALLDLSFESQSQQLGSIQADELLHSEQLLYD